MKKSFWGYNTQEVDETVECLEASNTKLEKQVKQLRAEMDALRAERDRAVADASAFPEKERQLHDAGERYAALEAENGRLQASIHSLTAQLEEIGTNRDELAKTSEICRAAYQDMSEAKQKTKEKVEEFTDRFLVQWAAYRRRVLDISQEMKRIEEASREAFLSAADEILEKYAGIAEEGRVLHACVDNMEQEQEEIRSEVEKSLHSLESGQVETATQPESQKAPAQVDSPYAILRALQDRSKEKPQRAAETVTDSADEKKLTKLPARDFLPVQPQSDEIGISVGVNTRNIVND